ncbi:MAG: hypothetical protein ACK4IK_03590 [Bacteroidia bacterium]
MDNSKEFNQYLLKLLEKVANYINEFELSIMNEKGFLIYYDKQKVNYVKERLENEGYKFDYEIIAELIKSINDAEKEIKKDEEVNNKITLLLAKSKIDELAEKYSKAEDDWLYESIELDAVKVIADFCRFNNCNDIAIKIDELFQKAEDDLDAYDELFELIQDTESKFSVTDEYLDLRNYFIQKFWPN